jgi:hypothetical protein
MVQFVAEYRNWLLAFLAACFWFGVAGWYLGPIIWSAWRDRDADYFKDE